MSCCTMDQATLLDRAEKQNPIFVGSVDSMTLENSTKRGAARRVLAGGNGGNGGEGVLLGCSPEPQAQTPGKP